MCTFSDRADDKHPDGITIFYFGMAGAFAGTARGSTLARTTEPSVQDQQLTKRNDANVSRKAVGQPFPV